MALAMRLAISTSKPSTLPVVGFFRPNSGWSNLVPTTILPFFWRASMAEPAGNVGGALGVSVFDVSLFLSLPHAAANIPTAAAAATIRRIRDFLMFAPYGVC